MRLIASSRSPYVRKVLVCAHELGLADRIATETADEAGRAPYNPLTKVPTLILDDGTTLYDSPVICEYLDALDGTARLFPPAAPARWTVLRRQALADGIMDAATSRRMESTRPETFRWPEFDARQKRKVTRAVDAFETETQQGQLAVDGAAPTIGEIALACALGYLDFRFPEEDWRSGHKALADWYARFAERPAMRATEPRDS